MENKLYKQFIKVVKDMRMTRAEKDRVLNAILGPVHSSPWSVFEIRAWIHSHRAITVTVAIILMISFGGGGVVSASNNSLPGDTLYSVKVDVVEPVKVALSVTPETKAVTQTGLVNKRLEEAEALALNSGLDDTKINIIESLIDEHTQDFTVALDKVRGKGKDDEADDLSVALQADMNAHAILLAKIEEKNMVQSVSMMAVSSGPTSDISESNVPIETATMMVESVPSARMMKSAPINEMVTENTNDQRSTFGGNFSQRILERANRIQIAEEEQVDTEKYNEKKSSIKKDIEKAKESLGENVSDTFSGYSIIDDTSEPLKSEIKEESKRSIEQAEKSLKLAEEIEKKGDTKGAFNELRKSEREANKAKSLIRSGNKIEKGRGGKD